MISEDFIEQSKIKITEINPKQTIPHKHDEIILNSHNTNDKSLPKIIGSTENDDFYKMAFEFQEIMMIYESAVKQIETKLEILNKEYKVSGRRNPIETIKSRIKSPESIAAKLQKKGVPVTFKSMTANLNDIAGVRVICPYISLLN